ncbi:HAD family hydrolase [Shewanella marina]|uniref:HAD family hydrolase n=1 Tax=Shewanella marina TaxID=487319 RepID=UPI0006872F6D|nr:HAD family hydrolase [Shewanella marina]
MAIEHHVMFDIDGTLIYTYQTDLTCFAAALETVLGINLIDIEHWQQAPHITGSGIIDFYIEQLGLTAQRKHLQLQIKRQFICHVKYHLQHNAVQAVPGGLGFINYLRQRGDISISIATGGWLETAYLKLASAGIDVTDLPIASANDHYARIEIMKLALTKAQVTQQQKLTYVGDAIWDKQACERLGCNFIVRGDRVAHSQQINDFCDYSKVMAFIES